MRVRILAVGKRMPAWVDTACQEYLKRLPSELATDIIEINPAHRSGRYNAEQVMAKEADQLLAAVPKQSGIVALEVKGKAHSSESFAHQLDQWRQQFDHLCLLIGGPDGLHERCRQAAHGQWSLSPLTLPHPLVRVLVAEQLYRAWSLLSGHPYHRG